MRRRALAQAVWRATIDRMSDPVPAPRPLLVVRARVDPDYLEAFEAWHRRDHLTHMRRLHGIGRAWRWRNRQDPIGLHVMAYEFLSVQAVQAALASPEAAHARAEWNAWAECLQGFSMEVLAPLGPVAVYHHWN